MNDRCDTGAEWKLKILLGPNSRDPWEANNGKRDGEWQSELRNIEWMGNIIYSLKIETTKIKFVRTLHEYHKLYTS